MIKDGYVLVRLSWGKNTIKYWKTLVFPLTQIQQVWMAIKTPLCKRSNSTQNAFWITKKNLMKPNMNNFIIIFQFNSNCVLITKFLSQISSIVVSFGPHCTVCLPNQSDPIRLRVTQWSTRESFLLYNYNNFTLRWVISHRKKKNSLDITNVILTLTHYQWPNKFEAMRNDSCDHCI